MRYVSSKPDELEQPKENRRRIRHFCLICDYRRVASDLRSRSRQLPPDVLIDSGGAAIAAEIATVHSKTMGAARLPKSS